MLNNILYNCMLGSRACWLIVYALLSSAIDVCVCVLCCCFVDKNAFIDFPNGPHHMAMMAVLSQHTFTLFCFVPPITSALQRKMV